MPKHSATQHTLRQVLDLDVADALYFAHAKILTGFMVAMGAFEK
jgi:hypothetical protein